MRTDVAVAPPGIDVVAVVDAHESDAVVWWVALDDLASVSRLCGAWVLPRESSDRVAAVLGGRYVLFTTSGATLLEAAGIDATAVMDPEATLAAAARHLQGLQEAHEAHVRALPPTRSAADPSWPVLPARLTLLDAAPSIDTSPGVDPAVTRALAIARWVEGLCRAWAGLEEVRLSRKHLRPLGPEVARLLPVQCTAALVDVR